MMKGFIHPNGSYYEAANNLTGAAEVPKRPSVDHLWLAGAWVYVAPTPSNEKIIANLTNVVQAYLDATARTRNYDGILSLCSYAASANPKFGPEGLAGVAWRDAVWAACYTILAEVQAGQRAVPTADELLAELPAMVWPA